MDNYCFSNNLTISMLVHLHNTPVLKIKDSTLYCVSSLKIIKQNLQGVISSGVLDATVVTDPSVPLVVPLVWPCGDVMADAEVMVLVVIVDVIGVVTSVV